MTVDLITFALAEYQRQHERAALAVAQSPALRPRAEAACRAWLSVVLRLGGAHPDAAPWLDEVPIIGELAPLPDRYITAAHSLAPLNQVHKLLAHARDQAFAAALGHETKSAHPEPVEGALIQSAQFQRFDTLKALARRLGCFAPVMLPAPAQPNRQAA